MRCFDSDTKGNDKSSKCTIKKDTDFSDEKGPEYGGTEIDYGGDSEIDYDEKYNETNPIHFCEVFPDKRTSTQKSWLPCNKECFDQTTLCKSIQGKMCPYVGKCHCFVHRLGIFLKWGKCHGFKYKGLWHYSLDISIEKRLFLTKLKTWCVCSFFISLSKTASDICHIVVLFALTGTSELLASGEKKVVKTLQKPLCFCSKVLTRSQFFQLGKLGLSKKKVKNFLIRMLYLFKKNFFRFFFFKLVPIRKSYY